MEEIIEEIWKDVEKFGWAAISGNKQYYLDIIKEKGHAKGLHWIECDGEVIVNEIDRSYTIVFECGECAAKFNNRGLLYEHYKTYHQTNVPL